MASNKRLGQVDDLLTEISNLAVSATSRDVGEICVDSLEDRRGQMSTAPNSERVGSEIEVLNALNAGGDALSIPRTSSRLNRRETKSIKIDIPTEPPNFKYVGRLLGPRGTSIRELEEVTNCKIAIKGRGSMRDPERENYYRNRSGYEHLNENLHVRVTTTDNEGAKERMAMACSVIENLLVAKNDVYKQRQLVQLSLINGTYRPDYSILKQTELDS